jgi:RimJ/RimL family protein N-acetyltransferase
MPQSEYLLKSERLGFRLLKDTDFADLKKLDMDPEVRAHFPDGVSTPTQIKERISKNKASFQKYGFADFAVIELETGDFAGRAGFALIEGGEIEVGYVFLKNFWGHGLAQEGLRALLGWAKQNLDVHRIIAYAPKHHSASFNGMKKSEMRYFKTDRMRGVECDFYEYPF